MSWRVCMWNKTYLKVSVEVASFAWLDLGRCMVEIRQAEIAGRCGAKRVRLAGWLAVRCRSKLNWTRLIIESYFRRVNLIA